LNLKIGGATLNQTPIDWEGNKQNIIYALEYARLNDVQLLCLPEMCISGYGCEDLFLSDWLYEKAMQKLLELRAYCYDITVCLGLPLQFKGKNYNVTCLIQNTKIIGFYAKQFLANDGIFYEHRWFTPWERGKVESFEMIERGSSTFYPLGDAIFELNFLNDVEKKLKIGFEICEDAWRTNDRPAFYHKERGVDIIINPSASNFEFGKTQLRENLVVISSQKFDCVYLYANLLGNESGKVIFDGEIIIAQKGNLIAKNTLLSFQNFNLTAATIDFENKQNTKSFIAKNTFISKELELRDALSLALFDYLRKSKSKGFVLSLSGGADSSCCAVLVAEMVKKGIEELGISYFLSKANLIGLLSEPIHTDIEKQSTEIISKILTCVYQGTKNSSEPTFISAKKLANSIGSTFYDWKIDVDVHNFVSKIEICLDQDLTWETHDLALQNIQARTRSPAIWMLANLKNALLLTTSNRSEGDVGYCTMDGDTSGSIAPIAGVDKSFIKDWLIWAEHNLGYDGLQYVNHLEPSAELRPLEKVQKDEDDLMPYFILNEIEKLAIRQWKSPVEVYTILKSQNLLEASLLKKYIKKFYQLWSRNQWKRERLAPSFHLDLHNVDPRSWCRFPILSGGFEEELVALDKFQ
jgi:NAD+ synthase (glutamine-hydrolysing)